MKRIAFHTLGCKLNFTESSALAQRFEQAGFTVVPADTQADIYVINTCTVTAEAEKKCRQFIHRLHRLHPQAEIAVTGCFAELRSEELRAMAGVSHVLGTADKTQLIELIINEVNRQAAAADAAGTAVAPPVDSAAFTPLYSAKGRTRSFFKIQDGCDNFCTYCAIPYARGRSRSASIAQTVETARRIAADGFKEVVFTGVNIGDFGRKNGERLVDLLRTLLRIDGIERWRLSSIEPDLLDSEIIELVAGEPKLMPHFHIPLQAGADRVLREMHRHYDTAFFARKVEEIRRRLPDVFIAADVIVGFPTETAQDFEDGYRFIESLPISALHVFSYSARPEAVAYRYENAYAPGEKEERSRRLHALSDAKKAAFYERFSGQSAVVLWESELFRPTGRKSDAGTDDAAADGKTRNGQADDCMLGYTENYLRVAAPYDETKINTLESVLLDHAYLHPDKDRVMKIRPTETRANLQASCK